MKKSVILCFVICLLPAVVFADALYLKNGKVIEGKILQERKYSVKIEVDGFPYTYYLEEIERVEKDAAAPAAQETAQAVPERGVSATVVDRKMDLASRLLEVNGTRAGLTQIFNQAIETAPQKIRSQLKEILDADQIIERLVPIYSREFSSPELANYVAFFSSPAGKKYNEKSTQMMKLMMEESVKYFNEKVRELERK